LGKPAGTGTRGGIDPECLRHLNDPKCSGELIVEVGKATLTTHPSNQCSQPWAQPSYRGPAP
jgi:hypothetical protein